MKRLLERRYRASALELWLLVILSMVAGGMWMFVALLPVVAH